MLHWLKNNALVIIASVAVTLLAVRAYEYFFGDEPLPQDVRSDIMIAREEEKRDDAIEERDKLLFKINPTKDAEEPKFTVRGKIERPIEWVEVRDTVKKVVYRLHNIETILYGEVDDDEVRFLTVNNYVEFLGGQGRTLHVFERKTPNFYFALQEGNRKPFVTFNRPLLRWTGLWIGAGADYGQRPFLSLEGRATIFEFVELSAYIKSSPELGVTGKVRL